AHWCAGSHLRDQGVLLATQHGSSSADSRGRGAVGSLATPRDGDWILVTAPATVNRRSRGAYSRASILCYTGGRHERRMMAVGGARAMGRVSGAELLARALHAEGVETVFTLVGDQILPVVDAMLERGVRFVDTRHESAAMHMADGWARAT